jgi:hypothetical protein
VPLPEKVYLAAEDVEDKTLDLIADSELGVEALSGALAASDLVLRVFLTSARGYKEFRRRVSAAAGISDIYAQLAMPHFIWVAELSTRQQYAAKQVLGEVLWDATAAQLDPYAWLAIHYPGYLLLNDRNAHQAGITERKVTDTSAYPLYEHNLDAVNLV